MDNIGVLVRRRSPGSVENVEITEAVAQKLLDKWVRILHLEEWQIDFAWKVRESQMNGKECLGVTSLNGVSRFAEIQMLDPIDYTEAKHVPYDYERTLVHELLHLTFCDMDASGDELRDHLTHCMVDRMARALVAAERGEDE